MKAYLNSLILKHRRLDKKIAGSRLGAEQMREHKKVRLQLKDKIHRLRNSRPQGLPAPSNA